MKKQPEISFIAGGSDFLLKAGETKRAAVIVMLSQNARDRDAKTKIAEQIKNENYSFIKAIAKPKVTAVSKNTQIILYWDSETESIPGFEGYKIFKSTDPGFNDSYSVTDDHGILIYHKTSAIFDLDNGIPEFYPVNYNGFRYYLGKNSGLKHVWTDNAVNNGKTYYYAVVAYTRGDNNAGIFPAESTKRITVTPGGNIVTDDNTVRVLPAIESMGYQQTNGTLRGWFPTAILFYSIDFVRSADCQVCRLLCKPSLLHLLRRSANHHYRLRSSPLPFRHHPQHHALLPPNPFQQGRPYQITLNFTRAHRLPLASSASRASSAIRASSATIPSSATLASSAKRISPANRPTGPLPLVELPLASSASPAASAILASFRPTGLPQQL